MPRIHPIPLRAVGAPAVAGAVRRLVRGFALACLPWCLLAGAVSPWPSSARAAPEAAAPEGHLAARATRSTIYRCGRADFRQWPCPGGQPVAMDAQAPSKARQATARALALRDQRLADRMRTARQRREAAALQRRAIGIGGGTGQPERLAASSRSDTSRWPPGASPDRRLDARASPTGRTGRTGRTASPDVTGGQSFGHARSEVRQTPWPRTRKIKAPSVRQALGPTR